ncbi:sodium:proton antiporter [Hydrogenophaga sp.]|uniref:cation:proton antiporter n=1 Tax=Hydrogenophaga sp. TaxID=1904254 RepID=UPI002723361E|nr:cation:proton antiporter [Hydrogenophaga sp.]MDO9434275.1 cation:proton antiporter [Hydrogenophaga sp.]
MEVAAWSLIVGTLLVLMALSGSALKHLPLSTAMFYLLVGLAIGPLWFGLARVDPIADSKLLEHLTELVVVVSLFSVGLKLSVDLDDPRWLLALRLAVGSMLLTVALITLAGLALGLPLGAAVLLGSILAPTDPVLASDVQVADPEDRSRLRIALTGEGGLNDGTSFPFVMLGLGLLGLHPLGEWGVRWLLLDVVWAVCGGLAIGGVLGTLMGRLVLHLRMRHSQAVGYDDFLALGLIALSYGAALLTTSYGFLAVFAAGVALRRVERRETATHQHEPDVPEPEPEAVVEQALSAPKPPVDADHIATHPAHAPAFLAHAMLGSTERTERIGEVAAVVLLGAMLWAVDWSLVTWWFMPLLFVGIRPLSVAIGLAGSRVVPAQRRLIAWFGVRGIGSLYYLGYAINHGLDAALANTLVALTCGAIVVSIVVHGISVTPLMEKYEKRRSTKRPEE